MPLPHLTDADLEALALAPATIRDALAETLRAQARAHVHSAPKSMLAPKDGRLLLTTLAADDETGILAVKSLVQNPANAARGLPSVGALVTAINAQTGAPIATLDGNWITAARTAALSMLAAQFLARDDAQTVGFLGSGVQASSHLTALAALYPLRSIVIHARSAPTRLLAQAKALGLSASTVDSPRAAISHADIVISAMSRDHAAPDTLDADWLAPGAFASFVDLGHNWARPSFATLDILALDDLTQERAMTPETRLAPLDAFHGDLPALLSGTCPARQSAAQRTGFLFRGPATADLSLTALALKAAGLTPSPS
ncbi:NAD(P)-binding domain-containing protein [Aquicoccus sp. G2-2]|uniref:NAD(P)-binding domain-containing protein n=1 Tax=Aquicoccus sp. G2-2 TaxID=3092120 RepID=UPI002AE08975|nr:NAD(P)-binding domain-containing protein [Aquicoccus sp. G2-2]MEA1114350.1 NAD(P)-binding domain-containing protein [Aquicoccus sp. G2-2]